MLMDWERFLESIVGIIRTKQNPAALLEIRGKYYELLARLIPASVILKRIASRLVDSTPSRATQMEIVHWAAVYDQKMRRGGKEIVPLEAFTARCMALLAQARHSCIVFYSKPSNPSIHSNYSFIHSFIHSFNHSFIHSISISLTHLYHQQTLQRQYKPHSFFFFSYSSFAFPAPRLSQRQNGITTVSAAMAPRIAYSVYPLPQTTPFYPERTGQTQIVRFLKDRKGSQRGGQTTRMRHFLVLVERVLVHRTTRFQVAELARNRSHVLLELFSTTHHLTPSIPYAGSSSISIGNSTSISKPS